MLSEVFSSARYLVNAGGDRTDVVLSFSAWKGILTLLEDMDDRAVVREWVPKLKAGPPASGALRWEDVADEWEDDADV